MKTRNKALVLSLSAVLLVGASVFGTMAYLTSQTDVVENTFTVGKVAITLDEAKVDPYGVEEDDAARVTENGYKLIPGHEYVKDPTVHVAADSEESWLFVKVVNGIEDIEDETKTIASQMEAKGWTPVNGAANVYAYKDTVKAKANVVVFEKFAVKGDADQAQLEENADDTITIHAYAVQKERFDTAAAAWAAAPTAWTTETATE